MKKDVVRLSAEERQRLEQVVRVGKAAAYRIRHANILLAGWDNQYLLDLLAGGQPPAGRPALPTGL